MIALSVKTDINRIKVKLFELRSDVINKAVIRALNKMAAQVKTAASRVIREAGYNLRASAIKAQIKISRATPGNPSVLIRCSGRPIPLIEFGARQTRSGVSVMVKNGRKVIPDAFIATMPTGHRGVYQRVGKPHHRVIHNGKAQWSGLPIKQLFGPGIPDAFGNAKVQEALQRLVRDKFPSILEHEMKYLGK